MLNKSVETKHVFRTKMSHKSEMACPCNMDDTIIHNQVHFTYTIQKSSEVRGHNKGTIDNLQSRILVIAVLPGLRIRCGRVISVGSFESDVAVLWSWWSALGQGIFPSLVLVCSPRNHE